MAVCDSSLFAAARALVDERRVSAEVNDEVLLNVLSRNRSQINEITDEMRKTTLKHRAAMDMKDEQIEALQDEVGDVKRYARDLAAMVVAADNVDGAAFKVIMWLGSNKKTWMGHGYDWSVYHASISDGRGTFNDSVKRGRGRVTNG